MLVKEAQQAIFCLELQILTREAQLKLISAPV